jgi:hypothetical protein
MVVIPITRNVYILHDNYAELIVEHKTLGAISSTIDLENVDKIRGFYWTFNAQNGYIQYRTGDATGTTLQRFIMNTPKDKITDHIDGNKLNNIKANLRVITPEQSVWNTKRIGVSVDKRCKDKIKYRASITIHGKQISLGTYDKYEDACMAREEAEVKYFGEFRRISKFNFLK